MKAFRLFLSLSFLAILIPLSAHGASAQASLFISPSTQNVSIYSNPYITVNVSANANNLYAYQYEILYNQGMLNIAQSGIAEGPFLKAGGAQTLCIPVNTSAPGAIKNIACSRTGPSSISGSGNLTKLNFTVSSGFAPPAAAQISIVNSKLSDRNSQAIIHTINNGTINIYECLSGEKKPCGTTDAGECQLGTQACAGNKWELACAGNVEPAPEVCDSRDNDCDGYADENLGCQQQPGGGGGGPECSVGQSRSCSVAYKGKCASGTEICVGGTWAGCPQPSQEICNKEDDNCDGLADENLACECYLGESKSCGSNVGECKEGARQCSSIGAWGECAGESKPSAEVCNGKDDNCDGTIDENCVPEARITVCQDGFIPEGGCRCGEKFYRTGYCFGGFYSETGPREFPWITLTIFGIMIILIVTIVIIYKEFHKKGKSEITWKELMEKYKSMLLPAGHNLIFKQKTQIIVMHARRIQP